MSWRRSLLLFPSKLPYRAISCIHHTPLPDPRRHCCIGSTPPPLPPHSLATSPPFSRLIGTRLPSVTGHALKSHQSSLQQQEPQHQQDSFCLNRTMEAVQPLFGAWPCTQTVPIWKSDSKPIQSCYHFILSRVPPPEEKFYQPRAS